jgi:dipicolinate synthase subunit A
MSDKTAVAIIGGDARQAEMAEMFRKDGFDVRTFGLEKYTGKAHLTRATSILDAVRGTDCVILPLPINSGDKLNAPLADREIDFQEIFQLLEKQCVVGGRIPDEVEQKAMEYGVNLFDYYTREELIVANAIPTAEGAIAAAMRELDVTIHGISCLVLGFGRVGKILAKDLSGLGAHVTVAARKHSDIAWIGAYGHQAIRLRELPEKAGGYDLIYNTAPSLVLDRGILEKVKKDCLVIDLASKPGGVDFNAAGELGVKTLWLLSLPGKVAPVTSGLIVKNTVQNLLLERRMS